MLSLKNRRGGERKMEKKSSFLCLKSTKSIKWDNFFSHDIRNKNTKLFYLEQFFWFCIVFEKNWKNWFWTFPPLTTQKESIFVKRRSNFILSKIGHSFNSFQFSRTLLFLRFFLNRSNFILSKLGHSLNSFQFSRMWLFLKFFLNRSILFQEKFVTHLTAFNFQGFYFF